MSPAACRHSQPSFHRDGGRLDRSRSAALPTSWLAIAVALASFAIILLAFAGLALDIRDRRRMELEADRMRGLANAAVEGLIVCDGDVVTTVNNSFALLAGSTIDGVVGMKLE